jgi:hypothetical protein
MPYEKKYRLPDELGSHEVIVVGGVTGNNWRVICSVVGLSYTVELPRNRLVEIPPPLPEEPPVGTTVSFFPHWAVFPHYGISYKRQSRGHWLSPGSTKECSWADVIEAYSPSRYEMVIHKVKRKSA